MTMNIPARLSAPDAVLDPRIDDLLLRLRGLVLVALEHLPQLGRREVAAGVLFDEAVDRVAGAARGERNRDATVGAHRVPLGIGQRHPVPIEQTPLDVDTGGAMQFWSGMVALG